jgi:hypothetical protein
MRFLKKILSSVLILTLLSGCISRYKPGPLPELDAPLSVGADHKESITVAIKGLTITEIDRSYRLPLQKENIQPVLIVIENNSSRRLAFSKDNVQLYRYTAEYIAIDMKKSNSFRSVFFGFFICAAMLIVHPFSIVLAVPMFGETFRKKGINNKIKEYVVGNEIEDAIIEPGSEHYGVFYTKTISNRQEVLIELFDEDTGQVLRFSPRNE